ncbi:helix-turn-helix transcriptional regulator [Mycolicibacterium septicum]|uniref:helix-turn-helix transcriptional regulator n=1 Tax=Mycolicibacterium septicum TaxID=98668 RepID=UPI002360764A|nr:LuxR C-terminal-related transcriptional regulator [Mycolicibacterium septicum]
MSIFLANDSVRGAESPRGGATWWAREVELVDQLRALRSEVDRELAGRVSLPQVEWDVPWRAAEVVSVLTHASIDELRTLAGSETARAQRLCDLVLGLQQLAMDWYLYETAMRGQRLADCAAGLSRLRGIPGSAALLEASCQELVQRCGFHRAVVSQVESRGWKPLMLHNRSDVATGAWFTDWINQTVPLVSGAPEAEMLSRKRPSLVYDTANAPVYRPLIVQAGQSRSYVVAPLVLGSDVVGFLHTDHHPLDRRVDEADRDVAWAFADGFSHLYERAVLMERLRSHRDSVRELFFGALDRIDELCESGSQAGKSVAAESTAPSCGRTPVELTEREADVFRLMVTGASNHQIAHKLVITEGTVKSHVKHILRKYGAVNRAQAIAWALNG